MLILHDRRGIPLTTTFGDLKIGDVFQDEDGDICIKTSSNSMMWTAEGDHWNHALFDVDELIIPLRATITVERGA